MTRSIIPVHARSTRRVVYLLAVLLLMVFPALAAARPAAQAMPQWDLGDAPDSTNHFGVAMSAYPGVPANFPTVFDPVTGLPRGPRHFMPLANTWLGASASLEKDADQLPDADGVRNISPPANNPDNDGFDDGVFPVNPNGIVLPQCQQTNFNYIVSGAAGIPAHIAYVNVWIDFNRDGDWADTLNCVTPAGMAVSVPEWAVQNQAVNVVPGSVVWVTTPFFSFHPGGNAPTWMRINIAEQQAPTVAGKADGRGPVGAYQTGETEDYYLTPGPWGPGGAIVYTNSND